MNRVLVVDSDPSTAAFYKSTFGAHYQLQIVPNGKEALKKVASFSPDVAVVEMLLPDMPGWELVTQMRKHIPALPVVAIAATDSWQIVRKMRIVAGPILCYAVKPLKQGEMQEILSAAVSLQHKKSFGKVH